MEVNSDPSGDLVRIRPLKPVAYKSDVGQMMMIKAWLLLVHGLILGVGNR